MNFDKTLDDYLNSLPNNLSIYSSDSDSDISDDADLIPEPFNIEKHLKSQHIVTLGSLDSGDFKFEENQLKHIDDEIAKQKNLLKDIQNYKFSQKIENKAALKIQIWYRTVREIKRETDLIKKELAEIRENERKEYLRVENLRMKNENESAVKIQNWYRYTSKNIKFKQLISTFTKNHAARKIQIFYRNVLKSRKIKTAEHYNSIVQDCLERKTAVRTIENWYFSMVLLNNAKYELKRRRKAVEVIHRVVGTYIWKMKVVKAVLVIQFRVRIWLFRRLRSAKLIQRCFRAFFQRKVNRTNSALVIQRNYRKYARNVLETRSAKVIQAGFRGMIARKLVTKLAREAKILTINNYPRITQLCSLDFKIVKLDLSNQNLNTFPGVPHTVKFLHLSKNNIRLPLSHGLPENLILLDVSNNNLNSLTLKSKNLQFLKASSNQIRKFSTENLPELQYLDLSRNCLVNVDLRTNFDGISENSLDSKGAITITSKLVHADLSKNKICKISFCENPGQHLLTSLELSRNLLAKSPVFFFIDHEDSYPFLQEINLEENYVAGDNSYSESSYKSEIVDSNKLVDALFFNSDIHGIEKLQKSQMDMHEKIILAELDGFTEVEFSGFEDKSEKMTEVAGNKPENNHNITNSEPSTENNPKSEHEKQQTPEAEKIKSTNQAYFLHSSATKIQALFRGYIVRKMFSDAEIENIEDTSWLKSIENSTVTDSIQILAEEDIIDSDAMTTCQSSHVSIFEYFNRPGTSSTQATGDTRYSAYQSSNYEQFIPGRKVRDRSYVEESKNRLVLERDTSENRIGNSSHNLTNRNVYNQNLSNQNLSTQNLSNQNLSNQNVSNHKITKPMKTEQVREEWNISEKTAELMMQRAKRMNKKSKKSKPKKPSLPPLNQALSSSSRYRLPNK